MAQVTARSGISQSQISRIEAGFAGVTSQRLVDLATVYGVSPRKLLDGAVVRAMSDTDLDRIGQVIEFEEGVLKDHVPRPAPRLIRSVILSIFRQETAISHGSSKPFDATGYLDFLLSAINPPKP